MKLTTLLLIASATGCLVGSDSAEGPGSIAVRDPTDKDDHVNVQVGYVKSTGNAVCSGTIVAPRVVVTAAHCFPAGPALTFESEGFVTRVLATEKHPAWPGEVHPDDIAMLLLEDAAPFSPAPYDGTPVVADSRLLIVGFGKTSQTATDYGSRRSGTVRVTDVGDLIITRPDPSGGCGGDSGGGLLDGGRLVGVTSGARCGGDGATGFVRIDRHLDFINGWIAAWGQTPPPPPPPPSACGLLSPEVTLWPGDSVWACNNTNVLTHQTDGNVVLYHVIDGSLTPAWAAGTYGLVSQRLTYQSDGNLVLYGDGGALWASGTDGNPSTFAVVHDNGDFAIYNGIANPIWSTGTAR